MSDLGAQPVLDATQPTQGAMRSILDRNSNEEKDGDRGSSAEREEQGDHRDAITPDRKRRRESDAASEGAQSQPPGNDPIIGMAKGSTDQGWLSHCLQQVPAKLRAVLMDAPPELMGPDIDWDHAGDNAWESCHQVANAAFAQSNPRLEAADVWIMSNFDCKPGQRDYGAARNFHRMCCAHAFGQYTPPEGEQGGSELVAYPPGNHCLDTGKSGDLRDILSAMGEVMQNHATNNLNLAIENIGKIFKPKFDANGPTAETEDKEIQSMEDAEMISQVLPSFKYMSDRLQALETAASGPIDDVHIPSRRFWGQMEGIKRHDGFFQRVQWQNVQNERRGKATQKDANSELKPKSSGNTWVLPKLNEAFPTEKWHLRNHTFVIMHSIYLSQFCTDYEALSTFLIFFWRRIDAAGTSVPGTRPFTVYEMRTAFETHMRYWEDLTKKWYLKQPLQSDEPTTWSAMLKACSRAHRTSIADLRESLAPKQSLERPPKGDRKGDGKGRKGDRKKKGDPKGGKGDQKGKKGRKGDKKQKKPNEESRGDRATTPVEERQNQRVSLNTAPTGKAEGKGRKPKSEIPCKFFKRGKCEMDPCEYKH